MADKTEKLDIEINKGWINEDKINTYKVSSESKEFGKKETEDDRKQAENLLTEIQWENISEIPLEKPKENYPINPEIQATINQSNRPEEVKKEIQQSYINIDKTIKESKNEKWIAGFLGKIMNKILGQ